MTISKFKLTNQRGGGAAGAPTDAQYVTMALNGTLANERVLTAGNGIAITDGGAGGAATISAAIPYILIQDQKAQNTKGGDTVSPGWQTHDLNTEVADSGGYAALAANQITLAAGTYKASGWMRAYCTGFTGWKLYNITDGADLTLPVYCYWHAATDLEYPIPMDYTFTIAAQKVVEAQYQCTVARANFGLGNPSNLGIEIYLSLWLEKVA